MNERAQSILDYWFYDIDDSVILNKEVMAVSRWFKKSNHTDQEIREKFEEDVIKAKAGEYDSWTENIEERMALVILLDQFTRNIYRNMPEAFDADEKALALAIRSDKERVEKDTKLYYAIFLYMPFMHSEDLKAQERSVAAFGRVVDISEAKDDGNAQCYNYHLVYAKRHLEVIERFRRFPHRNQILGRPSTEKELEYLKKSGAGF